ncbi:hypothetical protein HNR42_001436 [Deinobacterium chartae]|uniref:DhaL domain-containing protein n=1 Tax=Deinobacterium chartae TaxID=521158 RepID=A0A841HYP6_9DEIO|nr:DAK2 domain-containing protein [Deinobacterium chartae]MBB6098013.1 hypothetical protein [Deinobacterium chartae]
MPEALRPADLAAALRFATDWLGVYREQVNALNVYPVPDGDTGTNMHLTLQSVRRELDTCDENDMESVARAISYGGLLGARGNSGVILSQLLKGFSETIRSVKTVDGRTLARALEKAAQSGYAAVMKPVEGTILTVAREVGEGARNSRGATPLEVLHDALTSGRAGLERTPELLPVLKQAGVVDSGGQGYLYVLEGVLGYLEGKALPEAPAVESYAAQSLEHEEFGYCTEFLMEKATVPVEKIRELVQDFGDSLLVVGAEGFVKGHIHTNEPDQLLATVARYGTMVRTKVEDMSEQHTEILSMAGAAARAEAETPQNGLVAVAAGYGLVKIFRSLGARVVSGGQTQNPSVQDIVDAVRSVTAHKVIVLPNNKNVVMAAQKAAELLGGRAVVLPTKTLGQGLGAAISFNEDEDTETLAAAMQESAARVTTLEVTRASRTVQLGEYDVREGEVIGLRDDELAHAGGSPEEAVIAMLEKVYATQDILTVFSGPNVTEEQLGTLQSHLEERFPNLEAEFHTGGPDLYDYLVTLE